MTAPRDAVAGVEFRAPEEASDRQARMSEMRARIWEWPMRALFGVLLAGFAIAATFAGGYWFAALLALVAVAAAREWHRMVGGKQFAFELAATAGSIVIALLAGVAFPNAWWPAAALLAGSIIAAAVSWRRRASPLWSALGAFYIGLPALCLVALRMHAVFAGWLVLGLFVVVWAADSFAFIFGRFIGGPKLIPALSPNKTWSGVVGGLLAPAAVFSIYVLILGGNPWKAGVLGALLAAVGHVGDLFESWVKRRVGRKNSGSLIPGHGGVLDRIDSTLFVAPLAAALVFVFGLDPLFGGHP